MSQPTEFFSGVPGKRMLNGGGGGGGRNESIIAAGKLADMILIDGDPAKNIRDTGNITTIEKALGIAPRPPRR